MEHLFKNTCTAKRKSSSEMKKFQYPNNNIIFFLHNNNLFSSKYIGACKGCFNLSKDALVLAMCWPAGWSTSFIYKWLKLLICLDAIELMHCLNRSFMCIQFISSNSNKQIWDLLFRFRQKRMHLFWSICNSDFNL